MNKTIRNKALKDVSRLITADMNGEDWPCPDGYFSTSAPIYDGYRVKKSQIISNSRPDLAAVLSSTTRDYQPAEIGAKNEDANTIQVGNVYVNFDYFELLMNVHPDATPWVDDYKLSPIELREDDKLVAVIMPLKS